MSTKTFHHSHSHVGNDQVSLNLSRTFNIGSYESFRVEAGLRSDVREGEGVQEAFERVQKLVEAQLEHWTAFVERAFKEKKGRS